MPPVMRAADEVVIRQYEAADEDFVARLAQEAFGEYTAQPVTHTLSMTRTLTTLIALRGKRRIGFFSADLGRGETANLQAIAVVESERGRGVGRRLIQEFEQLARRRGARRLSLSTADSNVAALDLFLKRGFKLERRRARFYPRGQNACILVKELQPAP
jgi:[ribosomal protein S18]-alanine N-acetyltransferase